MSNQNQKTLPKQLTRLRHPRVTQEGLLSVRFIPDLTRFTSSCCARPKCQRHLLWAALRQKDPRWDNTPRYSGLRGTGHRYLPHAARKFETVCLPIGKQIRYKQYHNNYICFSRYVKYHYAFSFSQFSEKLVINPLHSSASTPKKIQNGTAHPALDSSLCQSPRAESVTAVNSGIGHGSNVTPSYSLQAARSPSTLLALLMK